MGIIEKIKNKLGLDKIKDLIRENLKKYKTTEEYRDWLEWTNVYGRKWVKPALCLVEYALSDKNFIDLKDSKIQIEHILPQNPSNKYWLERFSDEDRQNWRDSLANLTLLGDTKNSQASNLDFPSKKEAYFKKDKKTSSLAITQKLVKFDDWNVENLEQRENFLFDIINKKLDIF